MSQYGTARRRENMFYETWEAPRFKLPTVTWWKIVWFSLAIPRHASMLWLVARDGLTTGARLLNSGYAGDVLRLFCGGCLECKEHLFFSCNFSRRIPRGVEKKYY